MTAFVLLEILATRNRREAVMFQKMVAIGPMNTADKTKAEKFDSQATAMKCPAFHHALSFYQVVPVDQIDAVAANLIGEGDAKGGGA
ncbi:MAG: hypothetical protein ABL934_03055 [Lysobacteraceae bacterium]